MDDRYTQAQGQKAQTRVIRYRTRLISHCQHQPQCIMLHEEKKKTLEGTMRHLVRK